MGDRFGKCLTCNGKGSVTKQHDGAQYQEACPTCMESGHSGNALSWLEKYQNDLPEFQALQDALNNARSNW